MNHFDWASVAVIDEKDFCDLGSNSTGTSFGSQALNCRSRAIWEQNEVQAPVERLARIGPKPGTSLLVDRCITHL